MSISIILYGLPRVLVLFEVIKKNKTFNASNGGVAEKDSNSASGLLALFTSRTTNLDR